MADGNTESFANPLKPSSKTEQGSRWELVLVLLREMSSEQLEPDPRYMPMSIRFCKFVQQLGCTFRESDRFAALSLTVC